MSPAALDTPHLPHPPGRWTQTFKQAFCQRYSCHPSQFETAVFWRTLYRHALPFALLIHLWNPSFFKEDIDCIRELGDTRSPDLFKVEINFFHGRNLRDKNWIRRSFSIRISAKRLLALKNKVLRP